MPDITMVKLNNIHKAIAEAGHDTEKESAPDDVYDNLPECCKYIR
jgi:mercuric ion binding protein